MAVIGSIRRLYRSHSFRLFSLISIFCLGFSAMPASAGGFRLTNQDAFASGRGNAFSATANRASAVYYNAAGLTQLEERQLQLGVYAVNFSVDVDRGDVQYTNENKIQFVPQGFLADKIGDWSWGVGVYAPFGLGNEWPDDTGFRTITTFAEIVYLTLSPVIAREIAPGISIGAGLTINYAELDQRQGIGIVDGDEFRYEGDDIGVGFVLSGLAKIGERHRFGLNYRSAVDHRLSGESTNSLVPEPFGVSPGTVDITAPQIVILGYAFQPSPKWDIEFNLEWGNWSEIDELTVTNTVPTGDITVPYDWENGFIYQLGGTRYFKNSALSIGYDFNENFQTETFYNPAVADADRSWFNIGYTRFYDSSSWTLSYQYGISNRVIDESIGNPATGENANGDYRVEANNLYFTYSLNF